MKKIKIAFLLLAVVFAVGSAFVNKPTAKDGEKWYVFVGDDPTDASDYQLYNNGEGEPSCSALPDPDFVCAVFAPEDQTLIGKPDQTELTDIYNDSNQFQQTDPQSRLKYTEEP